MKLQQSLIKSKSNTIIGEGVISQSKAEVVELLVLSSLKQQKKSPVVERVQDEVHMMEMVTVKVV